MNEKEVKRFFLKDNKIERGFLYDRMKVFFVVFFPLCLYLTKVSGQQTGIWFLLGFLVLDGWSGENLFSFLEVKAIYI